MDRVACQGPPLLQLGDERALQGGGLDGGEDTTEGVMGRDAVGQLQKHPQGVMVVSRPVGDLDEVFAIRQHAAEADQKDIDEEMFEVASLPTGIGESLQLIEQCAGSADHRDSFRILSSASTKSSP
jgi:hypothetical protein